MRALFVPMRLLAIGLVALVVASAAASARCAEDLALLRNPDGTLARFTVELADTNESRARGLMFRETLPRDAGMLFIYERPTRAVFWMRNTLISLDMIFIDPTGTVRRVHPEARPLDDTTIDGGRNILMVLEINGGLAARSGIVEGSVLQHPNLPQSGAALPCP